MTEKKIDLSESEAGNTVYHVSYGVSEIYGIHYENNIKTIFVKGRSYGIDGKHEASDLYPTIFHNYQEFLDFHAIAPSRMTGKELVENFNLCKEAEIEGISLLREGFLLGGGQIIEEPANLPCPLCGNEMVDHEGHHVRHPNGDCVMA